MQYVQVTMGAKNSRLVIDERRQKLFALLSRGMKGYEIAKELNVDSGTVSRDIKQLSANSQSYLSDLAKGTLPFMYQTSIEGIRDVIKECYSIIQSQDSTRVLLLAYFFSLMTLLVVILKIDFGNIHKYLCKQ